MKYSSIATSSLYHQLFSPFLHEFVFPFPKHIPPIQWSTVFQRFHPRRLPPPTHEALRSWLDHWRPTATWMQRQPPGAAELRHVVDQTWRRSLRSVLLRRNCRGHLKDWCRCVFFFFCCCCQ